MTEPFIIQTPDLTLYQSERDRVLGELQNLLPGVEVFEVGSTAIPGVIGKGDIDFLVRSQEALFAQVRDRLDQAFPRHPNQLSNESYQGYKVPSPMDVAIQLTIKDGPYDDFLPFLEALTHNPHLIEAYNDLKRQWDGQPMSDYRHAKSQFIQKVLAQPSQKC